MEEQNIGCESAMKRFEEFILGLSQNEKDTAIDEEYLHRNFQLKETKTALRLPDIRKIHAAVFLKNKQLGEKKVKKNWTDDEISLLLWAARVQADRVNEDPSEFENESWKTVADLIPFKTAESCEIRWLLLRKNSVQGTPWTEQEDTLLKEIILKKGANSNKWNDIAKELYSLAVSKIFRKGKQCRERWNNHLDPDMKRGDWTLKEDLQLLELSSELGNKWSFIAKQLKERTENAVKNRYKSLLRRDDKQAKKEALVNEENNEKNCEIQQERIQKLIDKIRLNPMARNRSEQVDDKDANNTDQGNMSKEQNKDNQEEWRQNKQPFYPFNSNDSISPFPWQKSQAQRNDSAAVLTTQNLITSPNGSPEKRESFQIENNNNMDLEKSLNIKNIDCEKQKRKKNNPDILSQQQQFLQNSLPLFTLQPPLLLPLGIAETQSKFNQTQVKPDLSESTGTAKTSSSNKYSSTSSEITVSTNQSRDGFSTTSMLQSSYNQSLQDASFGSEAMKVKQLLQNQQQYSKTPINNLTAQSVCSPSSLLSPTSLLLRSLNGLCLSSCENTPANATKRRNTYTSDETIFDTIFKQRKVSLIPQQGYPESFNSLTGDSSGKKKVIIIKGNKNQVEEMDLEDEENRDTNSDRSSRESSPQSGEHKNLLNIKQVLVSDHRKDNSPTNTFNNQQRRSSLIYSGLKSAFRQFGSQVGSSCSNQQEKQQQSGCFNTSYPQSENPFISQQESHQKINSQDDQATIFTEEDNDLQKIQLKIDRTVETQHEDICSNQRLQQQFGNSQTQPKVEEISKDLTLHEDKTNKNQPLLLQLSQPAKGQGFQKNINFKLTNKVAASSGFVSFQSTNTPTSLISKPTASFLFQKETN